MTTVVTPPVPEGTSAPIPLSHNQNFLRAFDQGDEVGPFGPRYNIVVGWRITGEVDVPTLQLALDDVVARHETLRTTIVRDDQGGAEQVVHPPAPAHLTVRELAAAEPGRQRAVEEILGELEAGSYGPTVLPRLHAVLGRFDERDSVLVLIVHHTVSDGWSMQLLVRDVATCYAIRRGYDPEPLPPVSQYREYALWQQEAAADPSVEFSRDYWRTKLDGARVLGVATDTPRSAGLPKTSPVWRFSIPADVTGAVTRLARSARSSPFMVLLSAYGVLLHRRTGSTDLVVPTLTSGRNDPRFENTVGPFFNFVPLRTTIDDCGTFRDVLSKVRSTCVEAYSYDLPFAEIFAQAPGVMEPLSDDSLAACAFQVWQFATVMDHSRFGDIEVSEVRRRLLPQHDGTDIPDGALLTLDLDPSGEIYGNLAYNSNLYAESSMVALAADFCRVVAECVAAPDAPLRDA